MKLVRRAIIRTREGRAIPLAACELGGIDLAARTMAIKGEVQPNMALLLATSRLDGDLKANDEGRVIVPERDRHACERALELFKSLLSVAVEEKCTLTSPSPPMALIPGDDSDRSVVGIQLPQPGLGIARPINQARIGENVLNQLGDRLDGVMLVEEIISQESAIGRFRSAVRLFERAFAGSFHDIRKKLKQYLSAGYLGDCAPHVTRWVAQRDGAIHGDKPGHAPMVLEADLCLSAPFLVEVAYDVLINKTDWHDRSKTRRDIWSPSAFLRGGSELTTIRGYDFVSEQIALDPFECFPQAMQTVAVDDSWIY